MERPEAVQDDLHELVEHFHIGDASEEKGTAEQVAKPAKQEKGVAKPRLYRVRTKSMSDRLLDDCRE